MIWLLTSKNINPKMESSFMQHEEFSKLEELPLDKLIFQNIIPGGWGTFLYEKKRKIIGNFKRSIMYVDFYVH